MLRRFLNFQQGAASKQRGLILLTILNVTASSGSGNMLFRIRRRHEWMGMAQQFVSRLPIDRVYLEPLQYELASHRRE
jgi:hypothetical protein